MEKELLIYAISCPRHAYNLPLGWFKETLMEKLDFFKIFMTSFVCLFFHSVLEIEYIILRDSKGQSNYCGLKSDINVK